MATTFVAEDNLQNSVYSAAGADNITTTSLSLVNCESFPSFLTMLLSSQWPVDPLMTRSTKDVSYCATRCQCNGKGKGEKEEKTRTKTKTKIEKSSVPKTDLKLNYESDRFPGL